MRPKVYGVSGAHALFTVAEHGIVVNTRTLTASVLPLSEAENLAFWLAAPQTNAVGAWEEIARHALSSKSDVTVVAAGSDNRAYTVPKAVATTARAAFQTYRSYQPGVTAAGRRVAGLLSNNNQVSRDDVLYLSRFFKRNTEHSAGTPCWRLWGGDAGQSWSTQVVAKMPVTASSQNIEVDLLAFYEGTDSERTFWTDKEGEFAHTLYRRAEDNSWLAWGDGVWFACDDPSGERLVELDDDTAVYVASALYDAPDTPVSMRDQDPESWDVTVAGLEGIDWPMVERVMVAALDPNDHKYSPEERSKNAGAQLRDANGRFATVGATGKMKSGLRGTIVTVNPLDHALIVQAEDGRTYPIAASDFEVDDEPPQQPAATGPAGPKLPPLNLKNILGQPRATTTTPKAWLPKLLQPMGAGQLKQVVTDYEKFIENERRKRSKDFNPNHAPHFSDLTGDNPVPPPPVEEKLNPDTSDVPPLHLAIVDRDDPQAVTDLVALVPAGSTGGQATAYRRVAGEWVEDAKVLQDMRSPTPPPVVKLDEATYQNVLQQVDSNLPDDPGTPQQQPQPEQPAAGPTPSATPTPASAPAPVQAAAPPLELSIDLEPAAIWGWDENGDICAILAAGEGGLDRNRGNAEKLRRYWLYGKGGAKIRWGTGGDWTRCVRLLSKHLGERAKGYCALRHHEATGMWTGDRRNRQEHSLAAGGERILTTSEIKRTNQVITASGEHARALSAKQRVYGMADAIGPVPQNPEEISEGRVGRAFRIPHVIIEGLESGDGRTFEKGALSMRSFPLPLLWQIKTGDGHDGSFVVGRVDRVERTEDGLGNAYGVFDTGPYGQEAQRLVENKMLNWVSADLDRFEADEVPAQKLGPIPVIVPADEEEDDGPHKLSIKKGRLMGITLVPKPAFQECKIELEPLEEVVPVNDGTYEGEPVPEEIPALVASSGIAQRIPVEPPSLWFTRPVLNGPTPINVTDDGQVYGHIATWNTSHIGLPGSTRAPRSASNYAYFHTGVLRTAEGADVNVGQLTLAGGHADITADAATAVKHYDDTGSAIADVHVGEDSYGIWVAGALRPGTTAEQIRALRASAPSGDWRVINGRLELVACCQVNVPGFPVPRAQVAAGMVASLVAAGTETLSAMRKQPMDVLSERIARIELAEQRRDHERKEAALSRMRPFMQEREEKQKELENLAAAAQARVYKVLDVDGYLTEFKDFSPEKRENLAKEKKAMKDGSFPIENTADLRRAIKAYGRTTESKQAAVRRHIVRRARALDKPDMIPDNWTETSLNDLALLREDSRDVIVAAALANRADAVRKRLK